MKSMEFLRGQSIQLISELTLKTFVYILAMTFAPVFR